ncbi:hypothetical protein [Laspinema palackyanum]
MDVNLAEDFLLVCSNDFSRCFRVMANAITRAIRGTGAIASDGRYLA